MAGPTLSICIPTYNRAARLTAAVRALVAQIVDSGSEHEVEICVSDNASNDGTQVVLNELRAGTAVRLMTSHLPEHRNFAHNCLSAAKLATGEYIAVCGDDDPFVPEGVRHLLAACRTNANVILLNSHPTEHTKGLPSSLALANPLDCATRLGVFHASFIGNIVVRRDHFLRFFTPELLDSAYPHYAVVMRTLAMSGGMFLNRATVVVDDRLRSWRAYQAVYSAVDMARLQTEEVLTANASGTVVRRLYWQLCRNIPRALLALRSKQTKPIEGNRYGDLGLRNLLDSYRRSRSIQVLVFFLWLAGRLAPLLALRAALRIRGFARLALSRLVRAAMIQTRLSQ